MGMFLVVLAAICGAAEGEWTVRAESFSLGPVAAPFDLRTMVTNHLVRKSCLALEQTAARREEAFQNGDWQAWRDRVREQVRAALGELPFGPSGGPLNTRAVSRQERNGYTVENVLFESLPGMDVNASVYLPDPAVFPPPWPAVVVSVGHSTKTGESYQKPAQVFARCGYVALLYDPPGMAGEKQAGNDHFNDGVRSYAVGVSSNRYFVIDGLRAIDYLVSRGDVDPGAGVAATGVSGGGVTTMFMTLLDERIKVAGPSCCATPKAVHPVLDAYPECPEVLAYNRFNTFDDIDLLAAAMPAAVLLMAGRDDEVFTETMTRGIADAVSAAFESAGMDERFDLFMDTSGHAYTPGMALEFVRWMDRWLLNRPERILPEINPATLELLDASQLVCNPRQERNMAIENRDRAARLRETRALPTTAAVREIMGIEGPPVVPETRLGEPVRSWQHWVSELIVLPESDIALPATWLCPVDENRQSDAVLYLDDRGRWTDLRKQGAAAGWAGFLGGEQRARQLLTVDLRGWGDTAPAELPYDLAGWGGRERWIAYVSAALGDPIMVMRVRDGLAAYAWLRTRPEIRRVVVGGHSLGAVVALHVAALAGDVDGVFCNEMPASIEMLVTGEDSVWLPESYIPRMLCLYDLPDLAAMIPAPVLIHNPLDAARRPLDRETAESTFRESVVPDPGDHLVFDGDIAAFIDRIFSK